MPSRPRSRLLGPAALLLLGGLASAQKGSWGIRAELAATLGPLERWSDVLPARDRVIQLGSSALPEILACLARQEVRPPEGEPVRLDGLRSAVLLAAVGAFPRPEVLSFLGRLADLSDDARQRAAALQLLAVLGTRGDLRLALELATNEDPEAPIAPELRAAFESTLAAMCERDASTARALGGFFTRAHPSLQASIVTVLAGEGSSETLAQLAGLLGQASSAADALLLLEIGDLAQRLRGADHAPALERVRGYLGHPDPALAVLSCRAIEKLGDEEAIPELITLLDHADRNVRRAAQGAVSELTGLALGGESGAWLAWLDEELAWWDERAAACRVALSSGTGLEAAAALDDLAPRRLYPDRSCELYELALERPELDLVQLACRALAAVRSPRAVPALVGALQHADPRVVAQAWRSLKAITGLSLPPSARVWSARLGLEG
jgi:hypothetical protein